MSTPFFQSARKGIDRKIVLQLGLTIALCAITLSFSLNRFFYYQRMAWPFLAPVFAGAVIVLAVIRRSWLDFIWVLTGGLVLAALDFRVMDFRPLPIAGFSFAGLAALVVLGTRAIWAKGEEQELLLYAFVPSVFLVAAEWMTSWFLHLTESLHPKTLDLFLYSFDCSLGVQLSFLTGQLFLHWHSLGHVCVATYTALPFPLCLVYAARLCQKKEGALPVMLAFAVTGPIGVLFYNMLPACGPIYLFGGNFPLHPLALSDAMRLNLVAIPLQGARNSIPSLHLAWVLLAWWNSKGLARWVRAIAMAFVVLTVLATLGTGEHYFIDLVVAFPFSLMIQALCSYSLPFRGRERRNAFLFGAFATLIWLALLSFSTRIFWISPILPWTMVAATIMPSILLWNRLLLATEVEQMGKKDQTVPARAAAASA